MKVLGLTVTRIKAAVAAVSFPADSTRGGWWPIVREPSPGAWQRNQEIRASNVLAYAAVYACVTLIAADIGKLRMKLIQRVGKDIWEEAENPAYSPVLRKPNRWQTRIKFYEQWMVSKLLNGNTYVLKERDESRIVRAMYVLDPQRVRPLVAPDGSVFYELKRDDLSQQTEDGVIVPASEIIHDVMVPLYHPLCGVSPLTACGLAATQGLRIQQQSSVFFENGSNPGGVLSAPGFIREETAKRVKEEWESKFTGNNVGKVAVLGDGLKYEQMAVSAVDAQLIEQLKWSAENVCTAFHVPPYKVGIGPAPNYNNVEALNVEYYSQALQNPIESIELLIDEGLSLASDIGVEFDLDQLLRMDTPTRVIAARDAIGSGAMAPNEARKKFFGLGPVKGGDSPYLQQQQFSLSALAERDQDQPFAKPTPARPALPPGDDDVVDGEVVDDPEKSAGELLRKELELMTK